jgi:hypothetical protein
MNRNGGNPRSHRVARWLRHNAASITAVATVVATLATLISSCSGGGPA